MSLYRKIINGVDHWMVLNGATPTEVSYVEFKRLWVLRSGVMR